MELNRKEKKATSPESIESMGSQKRVEVEKGGKKGSREKHIAHYK